MRMRVRRQARRGLAAVELAVVFLFIVVPLMIGVWEVGRLVQVQQVVANSAREGARLAAQGYTINTSGAPTQIMLNSGTPNVHDTVFQYLYAAGLTSLQSTDVTVTFTYLAPRSDGAAATEPYQGEKNQPFQVTVTIPWNRVRWVNLGLVNPTTVTFTVVWRMTIDDPFTVNDTLPTW
jgi:Flp pilus assembly protein TadG